MSRQVSFSLRQNGVSIEIVRAPYPRESMLERGLIHEIRLFKAKRLEPLWEVPAREILFALRQLERTISCHSPLLSFIFFFFSFLFPPSFLLGVLLLFFITLAASLSVTWKNNASIFPFGKSSRWCVVVFFLSFPITIAGFSIRQ